MENSSSRKIWLSRAIAGLLLGLAILAAPAARAQTITTVSATIVDPNGYPWAGATVTIGLTATGTPTITPCATGPSCPLILPGQFILSPTGSFTLNLVANGSILPVSSTYTFSFSFPGIAPPLGTGPQSFSVTGQTIFGASQTLVISAAAPAIVSPVAGGSAQKSAATNFGVALTAQTLVTAAQNQGSANFSNIYTVTFYNWQSLLGTTCGAGSNTATPTLAWTGPGANAQTLALTALTIANNGAVDTNQQQTVTIATAPGSPITYTVASSLASAGCTQVPQYTVQAHALP